jgi:inhibitor of KinA
MGDSRNKRPLQFRPLGESAVTVQVEGGESWSQEMNNLLRSFVRTVQVAGFPGLIEAVAGIHTATVFYDPHLLYRGMDQLVRSYPGLDRPEPESLQEVVCRLLQLLWSRTEKDGGMDSRLIRIPVVYGGQWGPDLQDTARMCGLSGEELVRLHSSVEYRVLMIGFVPGFPYLEGLPEQLQAERLSVPRLRVPYGSVGIGGSQTGIYPLESPGGWRLIGRTALALFRPGEEEPSLLRAGDRVRFDPVESAEWDEPE